MSAGLEGGVERGGAHYEVDGPDPTGSNRSPVAWSKTWICAAGNDTRMASLSGVPFAILSVNAASPVRPA